MLTIPVALFGDYWTNPQEVEDQIRSGNISEPVHLDFQAEGVSITAAGIVQRLLAICNETGRSTGTIKLINNPNIVEHTPFENTNATKQHNQPFRSHFLSGDLLRDYWRDAPAVNSDAQLFGLFIGRRTVARDMILRDCMKQPEKFLFSMMLPGRCPMGYPFVISQCDQQEITQWIAHCEVEDFQKWRKEVDIPSLDGKRITDQYRRFVAQPETNKTILSFYPQFRIEIVPETYTRGDTFFPTEKTARPIMAGKPMLVYGPRRFLRRMRELHGFRTYGDCWDEGYDDLEGAARWRAMWETMQDISPRLLDQAQEIARYNRNTLEEMKEWRR
jgi:hypothetical protein